MQIESNLRSQDRRMTVGRGEKVQRDRRTDGDVGWWERDGFVFNGDARGTEGQGADALLMVGKER